MNQIAYTLEADAYISPEAHKKELEAIFYRTWQYACHISQLKNAGDYFAFSIGTQEIFVIKGRDDMVRAFFNVCPHRGHPLVSGCGNKQSLVCPYHAWNFFLNGQLCKARGSENVEGFDPARFNLTEARIEEFLGFYFVNLDEKAPSLKSLSGHLEKELGESVPYLSDLQNAATHSLESGANWKLIVDDEFDPNPEAITREVKTNSTYTQIGNDSWWLWPNLFLTRLPSHKAIAITCIRTKHVRETHLDLQFLSVDPVGTYENAISWLHDDKQAARVLRCENVQDGLGSRAYQRGLLFVSRDRLGNCEKALQHFHTLVRDALSRLKISSKTLRPSQRELNVPV